MSTKTVYTINENGPTKLKAPYHKHNKGTNYTHS